MSREYDVIVVGAGFAGVTAARELSRAGKSVAIVEARDRIGGRTWYAENRIRGFDVEMGGGWLGTEEVYAMAEVERYGIELQHDEGTPARMLWRSPAGFHQGALPVPFDQVADAERALFAMDLAAQRVAGTDFEDSAQVAALADLEVPLPELFKELNLPVETSGVLEGFWSGITSADWSHFSLLGAARLIAASGGAFMGFLGTVMLGPRFAHGTTSLVQAILDDSAVDLLLNTRVVAIRQDTGGVRVVTDDLELLASAVVCTSPLNALGQITFDPPLSDAKREAMRTGQPGRGYKLWMVAKNVEGGFFCIGTPGPFHHVFSLDERGDETLIVGFGEGPAPDIGDHAVVEAMLKQYLPGAELTACDLHDWREDEFSLGTWLVQSPGFITRYERELRRPEGRVFLAGGDYSAHRPGYIDGAIESGITVAKAVTDQLK